MAKHNLEGTQNITYLRKKDDRRSKKRCVNYLKDGSCKFYAKCMGSSHCSKYKEPIEQVKEIEKPTSKLIQSILNKNIKTSFSGIKLVDITDIKIKPSFSSRLPSQKKINEVITYYQINECLDKPVYVSLDGDKYLLEDKYARYCAAKQLELKMIPVRLGDEKKAQQEDYYFKKFFVVRHKKWGRGTIIAADSQRIVVFFDDFGEVHFETSACLREAYLKKVDENEVNNVKEMQSTKAEFEKNNTSASLESYHDFEKTAFRKKHESEYRHKEIATIKDTIGEKVYFSIVERKGESYYEIGKVKKLGSEKTYFDFSASATYQLYKLLKSHRNDASNAGKEVDDKKEVTGEFLNWNDREIDFVPAKEGCSGKNDLHRADITDTKKRLSEIKARIKNKNPFDDYRGISTRLMPHQKAACEIANEFERFAFFYDTGTGKTVLSLEIMASKRRQEDAKFLVICPKPIIKAAWMTDQEEFYPNMKLLPLSKNINLLDYKRINNRWNRIDQESNFHDKIFYPDWEFNRTKSEQFTYIRSVLLGKAEHYIVNGESFVRDFESYKQLGITGLIVDESAVLKNFDSKLCQRVREFSKECKYVYLLSGKPAPNNSSEYFSQMKIVDPETFFMSLKAFRSKYYHNYGGRLELLSNRKAELFEMIARKSIIVSKTDCIDLPDTSRVIRKFELPGKIMDKYNQMCYQLITSFKEMDKENEKKQNVNKVFVANNKLSSMMKLREITSGFIKNSEGISFAIDDSKQKELFDLIDEIGDNQVIIWCQFKYEIEQLADELIKKGKKVVTAFSGTINLDRSIAVFKEGKADILIAHPKTLQYGVTLVNCCFAIYYSMSYSFEQYEQSYARIYRKGQKNFCSYYFLQAENTIDEEIFECVMKKKHDVETCEHILKAINEHALRYTGV